MTAEPPISPWPFPDSVRRVLVVGGAFDPPHAAHVDVPRQTRDASFAGAALLFVPAAVSPFKIGQSQTPGDARLDMLRLAVAKLPLAAVWTDELDRASPAAPSYTVDTLRRARRVAPGAELFLVVGADQAAAFHRWRECREIIALARPVVLLRDPFPTLDALEGALRGAGFWSDEEIRAWRAWAVTNPAQPQNSTLVRETVRDSGVDAVPVGWLDPDVREYIRESGLYRT